MYERFSDRARHAMALANLEASKLKHDYLAPAHLMLGLIAEGGCVATEALRQLDVDLQRVRDDVCSRMKEGAEAGSLGRRAHTKAMKSVAGTMRLDLAQFRELEAFAQFAADLDAATKAQLARGVRTVEVLKQGIVSTMPMEEQVAVIFAVGKGLMDSIEVDQVRKFEAAMLQHLRDLPSEALAAIRETGKLEEETASKLREEIESFRTNHWGKPAKQEAGATA